MTRLLPSVHSLRLLAVLVALAGCGTTPGPTGEIRFWAMGREGEVVQQLMPEFERRHPGLRVRVQQIPWSAAHEKLLTAFVGGTMPDVFQAGSTWIAELATLGALTPLQELVATTTAVAPADYFAGIWEANLVNGNVHALPWYVDTRLLFYRTDLLAAAGYAEAPTDWATWKEAMRRVKARAGPASYAILLPVSEWQPPVIFALQRGAALLRDHDQYGDFQSPAFRSAFQFYLDLFRQDLAPASAEGQVANVYQDFAEGFFTFYITGPWNIGEFRARLPEALANAWATAPMPGPEPGKPGISIAGGSSLALSAGSPRRTAAWQLLAYLSEPAQQIAFYRLTGDLPARRSAWAEAGLADDRYARAFWQQLEHLRAPPKVAEWERIASAVTRYGEAAVRGELSEEEALRRLDAEVDALLEKRRWMLARRDRGDA